MYKKILLTILTTLSLNAHSLWVNAIKSSSPHEPHIMMSLGWGHGLPFGDSTNSLNGRVAIKDFELIKPNGDKIKLKKPEFKVDTPITNDKEFELFDIDMGLHKIKYNKKAKDSIYTLVATSVPSYFTAYIDTKNKKRFKLKPINEIKNVKNIIGSFKYQTNGTSYISVGKWQQPKPQGLKLEIIPLNDLSNVKVGDLLEFEVLFNGKKLSVDPFKSMDYLTAYGESFGQSDKFALFSFIQNGKASFRVQSKGQWLVNVAHKELVSKDGFLKDEYNKTKIVYYASTLTFNVK